MKMPKNKNKIVVAQQSKKNKKKINPFFSLASYQAASHAISKLAIIPIERARLAGASHLPIRPDRQSCPLRQPGKSVWETKKNAKASLVQPPVCGTGRGRGARQTAMLAKGAARKHQLDALSSGYFHPLCHHQCIDKCVHVKLKARAA